MISSVKVFQDNTFCYSSNPILNFRITNNPCQVQVETFIRVRSFFWACLLSLWLVIFSAVAKISCMTDFLLAHPGLCSFGMFKDSGPTVEQVKSVDLISELYPSLAYVQKLFIDYSSGVLLHASISIPLNKRSWKVEGFYDNITRPFKIFRLSKHRLHIGSSVLVGGKSTVPSMSTR